jgi:hypothetical protein
LVFSSRLKSCTAGKEGLKLIELLEVLKDGSTQLAAGI